MSSGTDRVISALQLYFWEQAPVRYTATDMAEKGSAATVTVSQIFEEMTGTTGGTEAPALDLCPASIARMFVSSSRFFG